MAAISHAHRQTGHKRVVYSGALACAGRFDCLNGLVGQNSFRHSSGQRRGSGFRPLSKGF